MSHFKNALIVLIIGATLSCNTQDSGPVELTNYEDSLSYSYGVQLAEALKQQNIEVDAKTVAAALTEALNENPQLTVQECRQVISRNSIMEGEQFLAENAQKEDVQTTESGLQYKILEEGTGETPEPTDVVKVHYTGKLVDGTVFDSSVERGEPVTFPLNGVIQGWTEGLQLLKEGGKAELYIPSNLGYGTRGAGGVIPPNATLIFEVELISIEEEGNS